MPSQLGKAAALKLDGWLEVCGDGRRLESVVDGEARAEAARFEAATCC